MKKLTVTYKAPPGDSKVVEAFGHTFYDGKEETVTVDDRLAAKMAGNPNFKCGEAEDAEPAQQETSEADAKAAKAADDAKLAAQGDPPPLRGAIRRPEPDEGEDDHEGDDHQETSAEKDPEATEQHGRGFRSGR